MKIAVVVKADLPSGVSVARFKEYVRDEVRAAIGMLPPEDPLFNLDRASVSVSTFKIAQAQGA